MIDENKEKTGDGGGGGASMICSVRSLIAFLLFLVITIQFSHKTDLSVGIICMVNHTATDRNTSDVTLNNTSGVKCLFLNETKTKDPDGEFYWDKSKQQFVLASYFYGYLLSQIPGGWFAYKYGAKNILMLAVLLGSIGTMLVPVLARHGYYTLLACRFLTGVVEGVMWPSITGIWSHWTPNLERSRTISFVGSGQNAGTMLGFSFGGYMCVHGFGGGWPSIFYIFGVAGILWCALWMFLASSTPSTHRFIKEEEKQYILNSINEEHKDVSFISIWKNIFTSKKCLALFVHHFCLSWSFSLFLTNCPTYIKEVLKFDVQSNGLLSAVPYIANTVVGLTCGYVSDKLIESKRVPVNIVRKIFSVLTLLIPAMAIVGLSFIKCDRPYLGVALLTIGIGSSGLASGGYMVTFNDLTGHYAGVTFAISNTIAQLTGVIVPYTVAAITKNQTQAEWSTVFILTASISLFGAIVSGIFGSIKAEPWAVRVKAAHSVNDDRYIVHDNYFY